MDQINQIHEKSPVNPLKFPPPPGSSSSTSPISPPSSIDLTNSLKLNVSLRSNSKKLELFENIPKDLIAEEKKLPTSRMRWVDTLRYHKPTEKERKEWNLSSSMERLHLHTVPDILAICGARCGRRFQSNRIQEIREIVLSLDHSFQQLDLFYQTLPCTMSRHRLSNGIRRDLIPLNTYTPYIKTKALKEAQAFCQRLLETHSSDFDIILSHFHSCMEFYVHTFLQLKKLRNLIETESPILSRSVDLLEENQENTIEIEFNSKVLTPYPMFLSILIQKYQREIHMFEWTPSITIENEGPPILSIAHFSVYLATIVSMKCILICLEAQAMSNLLEILKIPHSWTVPIDKESNSSVSNRCISIVEKQQTKGDGGVIIVLNHFSSQRNLAEQMFTFLSTVRELRTIPKDRQYLKLYGHHPILSGRSRTEIEQNEMDKNPRTVDHLKTFSIESK